MRLRLWKVLRRSGGQRRHAHDVLEPRSSRGDHREEAGEKLEAALLPVDDDRVRYRIRTIEGGVFWVTEGQMRAWIDIWSIDPTAPNAFQILRLPDEQERR